MKFNKTDHLYYKQELYKLLSQAKEKDIEGVSKMKKDELIEVLEGSE